MTDIDLFPYIQLFLVLAHMIESNNILFSFGRLIGWYERAKSKLNNRNQTDYFMLSGGSSSPLINPLVRL